MSRRLIREALPNSIDATSTEITVTVPSPYPELLSTITALLEKADLDGLIRLVPIRDTPCRTEVARSLRFRNAADYEAAARVRIRDDAALAAAVRALIGPMPSRCDSAGE